MQPETRQRLDLARRAAAEGAAVALASFRSVNLGVDRKADGSPVTEADRACEAHVRSLLAREAPDDGFLGEESGARAGRSGWTWIVDPVDGTKSFIHGVPLWGTLLAAERDGEVLVGVVALPALGETVYAGRGGGAWHHASGREPARARVNNASLNEGPVCYTSLAGFARAGVDGVLSGLRERCGLLRGWSDCYGHALVATGRAAAAVEPAISAWDVAPMAVILEEAGGVFFDFAGRRTIRGGTAVSANRRAGGELRELLRAASDPLER